MTFSSAAGRYATAVRLRAVDVVDVFVYLVVLGVFVQLFPDVISETFLLTLLTAVLLKIVLEIVVWTKQRIVGRLRASEALPRRVANSVALLLVMAGSKALVLELTALAFGDAVQLGGFFQVTVLILALMGARGGARYLLRRSSPAPTVGGCSTRRPTGQIHHPQHQHRAEGLVAVLGVPGGQQRAQRCFPIGRNSGLPAQLGADPPQAGPVVGVPMVHQQGGAGVELEVGGTLQPLRPLGFHPIHRHRQEVVGVHREDARHRVDTTVGMQRAQHPVIGSDESDPSLITGECRHVPIVAPRPKAGRYS